MTPKTAATLLFLLLAACGGPSEEDVLTADKIRASESAPELPEIQLSENPEPPPAPAPPPVAEPAPEEPADAATLDPLAPSGGPIPAAFQDRWGRVPADCRPGDVVGGALLVGGDSLMTGESVGRLVEILGDYPERFTGLFEYDGVEREEQLVLTGSSNTLIRIAGGQRYAYRRCRPAGPTG